MNRYRKTKILSIALSAALLLGGCTTPSSPFTSDISTPSDNQTTVTKQPTTTTRYPLVKPTVPKRDNNKVLIDVPLIHQFPEYPTGCESVAAVMALRYMGVDTSVANFIDNHLACSLNFRWENNQYYGPDPYKYFLGNPRTNNSYGCMAPVIKNAIISLLDDEQAVVDATGEDLSSLCKTYINNGYPVIIWASIKMLNVSYGTTWILPDGSTFSWPNNEHCMLLVGYDAGKYYFNDPYTGKLVSYSRLIAEKRYTQLGKQALIIQ